MALDAGILAALMGAKLAARVDGYVDDAVAKAAMMALAEAVVEHIQTNAVVVTTVALGIPVAVDPVSHVGTTTAVGSGQGVVS